jgi:transglutaminase-like putative cysteine protease
MKSSTRTFAAELLHGLVLGAAWFIFVRAFAAAAPAWFAALGGVLGAWGAGHLARLRVRAGVRGLVFVVAWAALQTAASLMARWTWVSEALGPVQVLASTDALGWFAAGLGAAGLLRTASGLGSRWASGLGGLLEATVITTAVASTLFAHRDGMIARPLEISDWFYSRGIDPVLAFTGVGAVAAVLAAGAWLRGRSVAQGLLVLALFAGLAGLTASWLQSAQPGSLLEAKGSRQAEEAEQRSQTGAPGAAQPNPNEPQADELQSPQRRRPVAVVVFHKDVEPFGGVLYFRTSSFSQFNGVRLVAPTSRTVAPGHARRAPTDGPIELPDPPGLEVREAVATDVAMLTDAEVPPALIDPVRYDPRPNPSPARFRRMVHVVSRPVTASVEDLLGYAPGDPTWEVERWQHYTELPSDPRYIELATRLVQPLDPSFADDPLAQALVIKQHLEETATYSYRRDYGAAEDPTAAFLFSEERLGYCVHLAHSMALLMRALGVPSRVSAGFAVPLSRKGTGSAALLTTGDAHAWAEIHLDGVGWLPIEVSPEKTEVEPSEPAYDLQQLLGEMARNEGRFERRSPDRWDLSWLRHAPWLVPVGGLLFVLWLWSVRVWRQLAPHVARPERRVGLTYRATLDVLSSLGFARRPEETWEAFGQRVAPAVPSLRPLSEQFLRVALSPHRAAARQRGPVFSRLARDVRIEARSAAGWRRFTAPFEVWCWWRVR